MVNYDYTDTEIKKELISMGFKATKNNVTKVRKQLQSSLDLYWQEILIDAIYQCEAMEY